MQQVLKNDKVSKRLRDVVIRLMEMQLGAYETNLKKILDKVKDLNDKQLIITIELEEIR